MADGMDQGQGVGDQDLHSVPNHPSKQSGVPGHPHDAERS